MIYIQGDQVGSPNLITNASGVLVNRTKNLPFGERLVDGLPGAPKSLRRFTNHEEDPDSNAIYMQARTYLAGYGKFAQVDPAYDQTKDDPETWNLYNYVTNNPVTKTDPDGRMTSQGAMLLSTGSYMDKDGHVHFAEDMVSGAAQQSKAATEPPEQRTTVTAEGNQGTAGGAQGGGGTPIEAQRPSVETGGIPALTSEQQNGTKDVLSGSGALMKNGTPPLQPSPDQDVVTLVSRPVDTTGMGGVKGLVVGMFEHSGTVIQTKTGDYVVQSGPAQDGSGQNLANVQRFDSGKGVSTFAQGGQVTIVAKWFVSSGSITPAMVNGLVKQWNGMNHPYNAQNGSTTCNTFSRWFEGRLGLQVPSNTSFWMRGWNTVIP
ncbi:RHS repeat-associated core domain-containing protein [Geothrix sp. 21YS21S-4]|uniref:RHS repeat-associated core domain-containing protein n=1 Tax=Geothrix sp. 21YS21S-4 TaxID=3068889 RepID=UPI0027B8DFFE|nr:RHS repeat-associated core domain-containing protein [Geothrix sp. 21YS21S-4]